MSLGMQEILPDGGLASFQNHVSRIADLGRYEDAYIVHAAEGETVVPMAVFDENPRLKAMLFAQMRGMGIDPERYIVGNELNSINPVTGQPEFFLKQIFKSAKKALKKIAPYAGTIAGLAGAGPWASAAIGAGVPLLMGEDAGAALAGGIGGYGAGSAFGTAEWARRAGKTGYDDYALAKLFGDQGGIGAAFDQVKSNLGFSAPTSGTELTAAQAEIAGEGAQVGDVVSKLTDSQADRLMNRGFEFKHGELINPASANWEPWAKTAAMFAPLAVSGRDENKGPPSGWDDIYPKQPWYGNWAADGGIINAYDDGGDVDAEEVQVARMSGTKREKAIRILNMMYDDAIAMPSGPEKDAALERANAFYSQIIPILQGANGGIINAYDRGGPVDMPYDPAQEGYGIGFQVDEDEDRQYRFDEKGMTNEARQAFLAREGITPMVGGIMGEKRDFNPADYKEAYLMLMQNLYPNTDREIHEQEYDNWFRGGPDSEYYEDRKNRLLKFLSNMPGGGAGYESAEEHWAEKTKDQDYDINPNVKAHAERNYTEDKYADGGIAHLAGGSFPRMTGAISGPGGPRDDMVPAMLSDGEFVMTAEAVRNAGGGNRREGARRMYQLMNQLQGVA